MSRKKKSDTIEVITPEELRRMLNKEFGEGTAKLGNDPVFQLQRIPTGIVTLDYMLSGGLPRNRHVELFGSSSVGKTTVALKTAANCQRMGMLAAYVDAENSFDPEFAESLGVDVDELDVHQQKSGEVCIRYMETLLYGGLHKVVILDSIASLLPQQEKEATIDKGSMGMEQAKLMSKALRRLTTANNDTVVIFINQLRDNIGVSFGKKTTTSGGRAMAFYAGIRIELVKIETIKKKRKVVDEKTGEIVEKEVPVAHRVLARAEKDKTGSTARMYEETTFVFDYEKADVDHVEGLLHVGRQIGVIQKSNNTWWLDGYDDEKQAGRPKFKKWLGKNRAVREELEEMILNGVPEEEDDSEEDEDG